MERTCSLLSSLLQSSPGPPPCSLLCQLCDRLRDFAQALTLHPSQTSSKSLFRHHSSMRNFTIQFKITTPSSSLALIFYSSLFTFLCTKLFIYLIELCSILFCPFFVGISLTPVTVPGSQKTKYLLKD